MAKIINPRAIRRKIRSVQNLKKITKAMEMVSASKLKKVQGRLLSIRPYSDKLREVLQHLFAQVGSADIEAPMLKPRPKVRKIAYVVVTSDKGLAGAYNANMLRLAYETTTEEPRAVLYTVGRKGGDFYRRRGVVPAGHWQGLPADLGLRQVREIADAVIGAYRLEEVDEVYLLYTEFVNAVTFRPRLLKFLPFEAGGEAAKTAEKRLARAEGGPAAGAAGLPPSAGRHKPPRRGGDVMGGLDEKGGREAAPYGFIFEPEAKTILAALIPRFVEVLFYRLLLEALSSEHAARMQAMHNATENAEELVDSLTLSYNKARQAAITKELLDIVGGAEALKG